MDAGPIQGYPLRMRTRYAPWGAALLAVLVCSCGPSIRPTPADVYQYAPRADGRLALWTCTVALGWTEDQLLMQCGPPALEMPHAVAGRCLLYPSVATSFVLAVGPPYLAVCLVPESVARRSSGRLSTRERSAAPADEPWVVWGVYAISAPPQP